MTNEQPRAPADASHDALNWQAICELLARTDFAGATVPNPRDLTLPAPGESPDSSSR
jgi:hypothetical protein